MRIDRQCLSDQIRKALVQQIVSGQRTPGERLVELTLANEFQTSQTPVREALHDLEAMRMVESLPHRGVRVREVSEVEMAEAYSIRGLLEEFAAEPAARLLNGNVKCLRDLAALSKKAADSKDLVAYADADFAFHHSIVTASANQTLVRLWDSLAFEFRTPLNMARHPPNLKQAVADHVAVVKALEEGDGKLAGKLLREHAESFIPDRNTPAGKPSTSRRRR